MNMLELNYMRQLVIGIREIQKKLIIHNDLNPKSIMISNNNTLKITSFASSMVYL